MMDSRGYAMTAMSFLMVLPALLLVAVLFDMSHTGSSSASTNLGSDAVLQTAKDVERDVPILTGQVLMEEDKKVIQSGKGLQNSRESVKNNLQAKLDSKYEYYGNNTGLKVRCEVRAVDSSAEPFEVEVNSTVWVEKGDIIHVENLTQEVSIISPQCRVADPVPFIKCEGHGGVTNTSERIVYGSSLENYFNSRGVPNAGAYENATSPLFIKKCPYDPYKSHGESEGFIVLKNCIDNGYFHESSDGSCFLCRLEGKSTCFHYGFETFVVPAHSPNNTVNSAPCSSDHVIFNDTNPDGSGTYPGNSVIYYQDGGYYFKLFLDNGHQNKYGIIGF
ncbi:hypothetical protein J2756_001108 [Methanobacterium aggregans]|nr:hypothetical protein [Methanobacterium aggregans]